MTSNRLIPPVKLLFFSNEIQLGRGMCVEGKVSHDQTSRDAFPRNVVTYCLARRGAFLHTGHVQHWAK